MPAPDRKRRLTAFVVAMAVLIATPLAVIASDQFSDVPDSNVFHDDIGWLADAGITKGCNPPDNTEFCPKDEVTHEQMSAFMRRFAQYIGAEDGTRDGGLYRWFLAWRDDRQTRVVIAGRNRRI